MKKCGVTKSHWIGNACGYTSSVSFADTFPSRGRLGTFVNAPYIGLSVGANIVRPKNFPLPIHNRCVILLFLREGGDIILVFFQHFCLVLWNIASYAEFQ